MTNTYDPTTTIGQIRLLCLDREEPFIFSDEEIEAFYVIEGDIRLSAALALEDMAQNKALAVKVKKLDGIELVSGVDLSAHLMRRAESIRSSVNSAAAFAVADWQEE